MPRRNAKGPKAKENVQVSEVRVNKDGDTEKVIREQYIIHGNMYGRFLLIREPDVWVIASDAEPGKMIDLKKEIERRKGI